MWRVERGPVSEFELFHLQGVHSVIGENIFLNFTLVQ